MKKYVKGIVADSVNCEKTGGMEAGRDAFGMRLQTYLQRELKLTPRQIKGAKFREKGILVNGARRRVTERVYPGDVVEVLLEDDGFGSSQLLPLQRELAVLYEDEDILAVNKPPGLVVHPSHGHYQDSLANAVSYYFSSRGERVKVRPVGRLDKETSGIVVFAKNQAAAGRLAVQKEQGIFQKQYLALVQGQPDPPSGTIAADMAKDEATLMKMKVCKKGMRAVTHYRTKKSNGMYSLVELKIETGRTHQIRVHMAFAGHPLLGDRLYGERAGIGPGEAFQGIPAGPVFADSLSRAALHAGRCVFGQPFTGEEICIKAPMPGDMERLCQAL